MPRVVLEVNTQSERINLNIQLFHAWSGNKGVRFYSLTLLTSNFTPGLEISGLF